MMKITKPTSILFLLFVLLLGMSSAWTQNKEQEKKIPLDAVVQPRALTLEEDVPSKPFVSDASTKSASGLKNSAKTSGYVAKNEGIQSLFNALSSEMKKPFVLSKLAQKKTVTGDFDISNPQKFLDTFSNQIGLAWYDDGQTIYVYDNSELKNSVVIMRNGSLASLNEFLQRAGLFTKRYPIRGEQKTGAFYVTGPPIYVDLVVNAAAYLDDLYKNVDLNKQKIRVIKLQYTSVADRSYKVRDQQVTISGIGKVIEAILANEFKELVSIKEEPNIKSVVAPETPLASQAKGLLTAPTTNLPEKQVVNDRSRIRVIAYPETNSLLIKGTQEQIDLIEQLIEQLDVPKRHIELSLWVIDIKKSDLDQLGIDWQGAINIGSRGRVSFNAGSSGSSASTSTLDANRFLAQITALNTQGIAQVVTRPIILTQDNVPAVFENRDTLYARLQGERVASLEGVTYGTVINVLPRYSTSGEEVEMVLDIEDGQQAGTNVTSTGTGDIPVISRTKISTVARVPKGKSLLIGGSTRDEYSTDTRKIPLLGDLPLIGSAFRFNSDTSNKRVRIYLIQPKLLDLGSAWDPQDFTEPSMLSPDLPVNDAVKALDKYPRVEDGRH